MFFIDDASLIGEAANSDGVYHVDVANKIQRIFVSGAEVHNVVFVDTNRGFLIKSKTDITGKPTVCDGNFIQEFCFGEITLEFL